MARAFRARVAGAAGPPAREFVTAADACLSGAAEAHSRVRRPSRSVPGRGGRFPYRLERRYPARHPGAHREVHHQPSHAWAAMTGTGVATGYRLARVEPQDVWEPRVGPHSV